MRKIKLPDLVIHQDTNANITLYYPASTRRFWCATTALVEIFLSQGFVKEALRKLPKTAASWRRARKILRRLASSSSSIRLTVDETHDCADLIAIMCFQFFQSGKNWKRTAALILVWGQIARYQFVGQRQDKDYPKMDQGDPAAQCYKRFIKEVKKKASWLPMHEVYRQWVTMSHYEGKDERILGLKLSLEGISNQYRRALEVGGLTDWTP